MGWSYIQNNRWYFQSEWLSKQLKKIKKNLDVGFFVNVEERIFEDVGLIRQKSISNKDQEDKFAKTLVLGRSEGMWKRFSRYNGTKLT